MREDEQTTGSDSSAADGGSGNGASGAGGRERILGTLTFTCVVLGLVAAAVVQTRQAPAAQASALGADEPAAPSASPAPAPTPTQAAGLAPASAESPVPGAPASPAPSVGTGPSAGPSGPPSVTPLPSVSEPVGGVDWSTLTYPMNCYGDGYTVQAVRTGDLIGDGSQEAAVAVACQAGGGSPPSAVYVYRVQPLPAGTTSPQLLATLLNPSRTTGEVVTLTADASGVTFDTLGYSSTSVVAASPDAHTHQHWAWNGATFTQS